MCLGRQNYIRNARFPYLFFKEQQSPGPSCQSSKQLFPLAGAALQGGAQRVPFSSPVGCPPTLSRWLRYRSWHLRRSSAVYVVNVSQARSPAAGWRLGEIMRNAENVLLWRTRWNARTAADRSVGLRAVGGLEGRQPLRLSPNTAK